MSQAVSELVNEELQMKWWCYATISLTNINQIEYGALSKKSARRFSELVKEFQL